MAFNKGSRTNNWTTENNLSDVWGAASFVQENGWNNASTGGGVNDRTSRATLLGQGAFSQQTDKHIEDTWGQKMVDDLNKGRKEQ